MYIEGNTEGGEKVQDRVARWYVFEPKIQIRESFGGPWNEKSWYILWPFGIRMLHQFGICYDHSVIFGQFGIISPVLVFKKKKNLATPVQEGALASCLQST
jgi:hypothetical protein